jgi:hypothetical protein
VLQLARHASNLARISALNGGANRGGVQIMDLTCSTPSLWALERLFIRWGPEVLQEVCTLGAKSAESSKVYVNDSSYLPRVHNAPNWQAFGKR